MARRFCQTSWGITVHRVFFAATKAFKHAEWQYLHFGFSWLFKELGLVLFGTGRGRFTARPVENACAVARVANPSFKNFPFSHTVCANFPGYLAYVTLSPFDPSTEFTLQPNAVVHRKHEHSTPVRIIADRANNRSCGLEERESLPLYPPSMNKVARVMVINRQPQDDVFCRNDITLAAGIFEEAHDSPESATTDAQIKSLSKTKPER